MTTIKKNEAVALREAFDVLDRKLRDELREELARSGSTRFEELAGTVHDEGDEAVAIEMMDLENELISRHVLQLRALEDARRRLDDGTIDECAECGGEIGYKRLLVYPSALRCVICQEAFDRTHMHAARPRL